MSNVHKHSWKKLFGLCVLDLPTKVIDELKENGNLWRVLKPIGNYEIEYADGHANVLIWERIGRKCTCGKEIHYPNHY